MYCRDFHRVGDSPVHSGLLCAAHGQDADIGFDTAGADVIAVAPEPSETHAAPALFKIKQRAERLRRGGKLPRADAPDPARRALRPAAQEQSAALAGVFASESERVDSGVEMFAGVGEVVHEKRVREGVAA